MTVVIGICKLHFAIRKLNFSANWRSWAHNDTSFITSLTGYIYNDYDPTVFDFDVCNTSYEIIKPYLFTFQLAQYFYYKNLIQLCSWLWWSLCVAYNFCACQKDASQCGRPARLNNLSSYSPGWLNNHLIRIIFNLWLRWSWRHIMPLPLRCQRHSIVSNQHRKERPPLQRPVVLTIVTSCQKDTSQCGRPARLNNLSSYSPDWLNNHLIRLIFN